MAQINLYVPDELEAKIKQLAFQSHKSVSGYVVDVIREKLEPSSWSAAFRDLLKSESPSDIPEVEDLPLQTRDPLEDT